MIRRVILICLLIMITILANGCWDRRELESLGLVQALGLDLGPDQKGVTVTTMIAIPSRLGGEQGGGAGDKPGVFLVSMDAPSIYEAFNLINTTVNREITLIQNRVLIIGEELARHGVERWIDNLIRYREMRRTLLIFVCKGKAAKILRVQPQLENKPSEYVNALVALSRRTGMYPSVTLNDFLKNYEAFAQENYLPLLDKYLRKEGPEPETGPAENQPQSGGGVSKSGAGGTSQEKDPQKKDDLRFIGSAIFKKDRMVGSFDVYETQILLLLNDEFKEAMLTIEDPLKKGNYVVFKLLATAPVKIEYQRQKKVDQFKVHLKLEADLLSIQSQIDYTQPKLEEFLGRVIAGELKNRVEKAIKKAQQEYNSDVFGFGKKVRSTFITSGDYEKYLWPDKFKDARINAEVKIDLRRVGVQFEPPESR